MMRIPSQFNDDNLYGRRPKRGETLETNRRLLRLVLGLALVFVVMKQASNPAIYQTFFSPSNSQKVPSTQLVAGGMQGQSSDPNSQIAFGRVHQKDLDADVHDPEDRKVAAAVTESLLPSDRRLWVVVLARWTTGRRVQEIPSTVDEITQVLGDDTQLAEIGSPRRQVWIELLDAISKAVLDNEMPEPDAALLAAAKAWLAELDRLSAAEVVDGTVWRSGDAASMYRYLDQAPFLSADNVAASAVVPLLQQPDVYRTRMVTLAGSVARAERIEARDNAFGIQQYWHLWLRPDEGAQRPILAIVPDVPEIVAEVGEDSSLDEGPQITLVGRFLKRLAFRNEVGADLAPVVVGRLILVPVSAEQLQQASASDGQSSRLALLMLIATILGVAIAAVAMWRTSVMAKRTRLLRSAHRQTPTEFLQTLDASSDSDAASD